MNVQILRTEKGECSDYTAPTGAWNGVQRARHRVLKTGAIRLVAITGSRLSHLVGPAASG